MRTVAFLSSTLAAVLVTVMGAASAQVATKLPELKVGDSAPPLKVQTWLRGTPLTQFEKGKVYVVDFWATWCGGCHMAFPHLSAIAAKYKDKVTFMSIATGEDYGALKGKDPVPGVKQFLGTSPGQKLTLDVAVDGTSNAMWDAWIAHLHRVGLPTTYVIDQDGKVAWVDVNIDNLEWVLDEVLAKKWDRNKASAIKVQRDALEDMWMNSMRNGPRPGDDKPPSPEYIKAQQAVLTAAEKFERQFPDRKDAVAFYKYMALAVVESAKLPAILEQMAADPRSRYINLSDAAGLTMMKKDFPKATYAAAAKVLERCLRNEHPQSNTCGPNAGTYERLASAYGMAGEKGKAAATMEKAIALAGKEKLPVEQVRKMQESLKGFKGA